MQLSIVLTTGDCTRVNVLQVESNVDIEIGLGTAVGAFFMLHVHSRLGHSSLPHNIA